MNDSNLVNKNGSFRDPSGYVIEREGRIYRYIFPEYIEVYTSLKNQKFYDKLIEKGWLVPHYEIEESTNSVIIQAEKIPFVSYPFEWSFSQLKSAALLTLKIQYESLKHNVILKDASAYNVQFVGKKPVFIDTTSFELYKEGQTWTAYKQFCEHFISPLVLMKYIDTKCSQLLISNIDGIPLSLTSNLLPFSSNFNSLCALHIHAHSRKIRKYEQKFSKPKPSIHLPKKKLFQIIEHLYEQVEKLEIRKKSNWSDYYNNCSYDENSFTRKMNFVQKNISANFNAFILDIGCNEGIFSKVLSKNSSYIISIDNDERVIDSLFNKLDLFDKVLPLVVDITNPSPSIGWENTERPSFLNRIGNNNISIALALIHHLRIFYNIPMVQIAKLFAMISCELIIEFVPKNDIQVKKLLLNKKDTYDDYSESNFVSCFSKFFNINEIEPNDGRTLYKMTRK